MSVMGPTPRQRISSRQNLLRQMVGCALRKEIMSLTKRKYIRVLVQPFPIEPSRCVVLVVRVVVPSLSVQKFVSGSEHRYPV